MLWPSFITYDNLTTGCGTHYAHDLKHDCVETIYVES